jgi:hypothetical protein
MMKKTNKIMSLCLLAMMMVCSFAVSSCSDDDSTGGGTPEITGVKILSSDTLNYSYDNTYTKAGPGSMLAIMGNGLGGALKVRINGYEVYFNPTMNTANSIIISIPSDPEAFHLSSADSNIPDLIEVETPGGVATYKFKVTAPGPQLQRIEALYPREAGDTMKLHGLNLVDVEKVFITDISAAELDTTTWDKENAPGNHTDITDFFSIKQESVIEKGALTYGSTSIEGAVLPAEVPDSGTLVVQCAAGTTYLPFYKRPGKPVILSVSSDMPEIGEDLIIKGRDFVQVEAITYGDITLTPADYRVSASEDSIIIPFAKKPQVGSGTTLTVSTPGGKVSSEYFYDHSTILTTFDNGDATDNGWGPNASYVNSGTADGTYASINVPTEYQQWWGTMVYFRKDWNGNMFALSNNIPSTASADDVYLAYEVYDNNSDYNNGKFFGYLRYMIQPAGDAENVYDNFAFANGTGTFPDGPVLQDINGENHKGKWYRTQVPLSKFACYKGKTFAEIKNIGLNQFRIQSINQDTAPGKIDIRIDNVRVIYIPKK